MVIAGPRWACIHCETHAWEDHPLFSLHSLALNSFSLLTLTTKNKISVVPKSPFKAFFFFKGKCLYYEENNDLKNSNICSLQMITVSHWSYFRKLSSCTAIVGPQHFLPGIKLLQKFTSWFPSITSIHIRQGVPLKLEPCLREANLFLGFIF